MATQPQLVRLAEVADTLGAPIGWVANAAGKDVRAWWTNEPACDFATAAKIADEWSSNKAAALEATRKYEAEQEARIEREREEFRREREAERKGTPIPGGISVSVPGGPRPDWMGGDE
jgi:hypothetical protein